MTDDRSASRRPPGLDTEFDARPPGVEVPDGHATDTPGNGLVAPSECSGRAILETLGDGDCRSILTAVQGRALSVSEIAEACDLPSSTTYRKVDRLTDLGLLAEGVRVRATGGDVREYILATEDVLVRFQCDEDPKVRLARREAPEYPSPSESD